MKSLHHMERHRSIVMIRYPRQPTTRIPGSRKTKKSGGMVTKIVLKLVQKHLKDAGDYKRAK